MGPRAAPVHFCLANVHSSGSGGRNRFICRSEESVNENTALKVGGKKIHFASKSEAECKVSSRSVQQIYRGPILIVPSQCGNLQSEEVMKHHK